MHTDVGTLLSGRFRLERKIGTGGMSTVWVATDTVLERKIAIKIMDREIADDSDQLERFRREARAVARLNHPNIVRVIDAAEDHSSEFGLATPYIVFEYVEGETLKQRIRRLGRLPIPEAVAYAIEIARALGAAHASGIVHRDVKPQNVLLDRDGTAKVTDFGIARTLDQDGLTADGRVLGTTDYVSPEQALGHPVTGQSDLYSLGVVLYEMLTGEVPFHGDNQVKVAMQHIGNELPDLCIKRPEASAALASVLETATAKDLDRRYQSDRELIADLETLIAVEGRRGGKLDGQATALLPTLPPETRRRATVIGRDRRHALILLVSGLAVVGGIAFYITRNIERGTRQRPIATATDRPTVQPLSLGQGRARDYDPGGDGSEHRAMAPNIIDDDPQTVWTTETYNGPIAQLKNDAGPGVGIYLDAKPEAVVHALQIISPTPGWKGRVYLAGPGPVPNRLSEWTDSGAAIDARRQTTTVRFNAAARPYRYYLIWITELPPNVNSVAIAEASLLPNNGS